MTWAVVLTCLIAGAGVHIYVRRCPDHACVADAVARARRDPSVIRWQVFDPGTYQPFAASGLNPLPAAEDRWKS